MKPHIEPHIGIALNGKLFFWRAHNFESNSICCYLSLIFPTLMQDTLGHNQIVYIKKDFVTFIYIILYRQQVSIQLRNEKRKNFICVQYSKRIVNEICCVITILLLLRHVMYFNNKSTNIAAYLSFEKNIVCMDGNFWL